MHRNLPAICDSIRAALPPGWTVKAVSVHRTPAQQFEIFKKGRVFRNGSWVKVGTTYTTLDGYTKRSRHNTLPATACDIGLFRPDGSYLSSGPEENKIELGANDFGLTWGGSWPGFVDKPHLEVPLEQLFKRSLLHDEALQWQKYLWVSGQYTGMLDGIFGPKSLAALKAATGYDDRTPEAWRKLFETHGPVESLPGLGGFAHLPPV
ncbi:MAG: M15 family metallopeptidase [Verrucomicrobia bacterium]|nr:M15 family metallopeptidase [Verrucomicrobiota bacterium]